MTADSQNRMTYTMERVLRELAKRDSWSVEAMYINEIDALRAAHDSSEQTIRADERERCIESVKEWAKSMYIPGVTTMMEPAECARKIAAAIRSGK